MAVAAVENSAISVLYYGLIPKPANELTSMKPISPQELKRWLLEKQQIDKPHKHKQRHGLNASEKTLIVDISSSTLYWLTTTTTTITRVMVLFVISVAAI